MYIYIYIHTHTHTHMYICIGSNLGITREPSLTKEKDAVQRCPVRLSESKQLFYRQTVLITLVLRLIVNDDFSFDSVNRLFRVLPVFFVKSLMIAVRSSTERNNKIRSCTRAKQITYCAYLVAAVHL